MSFEPPSLINTWLQPGVEGRIDVLAVSTASRLQASQKPLKRFSFSPLRTTGLNGTMLGGILLALICHAALRASETNTQSQTEVTYTRTITERADKIVAKLELADPAKVTRVRDIIVQQYRDLNAIHTARDAQIKTAREKTGADKTTANAAIQTARDEAQPKLDKLHGEFLAKLSTELSQEQVEAVKDGLTYGVVPLTYGVYLKMYPELTDEQKKQIMRWLIEAREIAMDGSTSQEKHAVFGKYKGRINNYLSKAGYDAKKGEQNLKKTSQTKAETN